jgi:hypothetical protein
MTSKEFIIWLKGFTEGVHDFNVTPKQWDLLKEKLAEVNDNAFVETPGMFQVHQLPTYPPYIDPYNPYKVTCRGEETPTGTTITTTPGTSGILFTNPSTHTTFTTGSGAWHYTNTNQNLDNNE